MQPKINQGPRFLFFFHIDEPRRVKDFNLQHQQWHGHVQRWKSIVIKTEQVFRFIHSKSASVIKYIFISYQLKEFNEVHGFCLLWDSARRRHTGVANLPTLALQSRGGQIKYQTI